MVFVCLIFTRKQDINSFILKGLKREQTMGQHYSRFWGQTMNTILQKFTVVADLTREGRQRCRCGQFLRSPALG